MARHWLLLLVAIASLGACTTIADPAPSRPTTPAPATTSVTEGLDRYMEQRHHVEAVAWRLRRAALAECRRQDRTRRDTGIVVWSLANFPDATDRARLQQDWGLDDRVSVALAVEGAPAARAGLRAGDVILRVNGEALPVGTGGTQRFIARTHAATREGDLRLDLADGRSLTILPEETCDITPLLVRSADINAATDGRTIAITTGLYGLIRSDDELALILGHELAHNVLGHIGPKPQPRPTVARLPEILGLPASAEAAPYTPARETEADRAGLVFMARAGFDIAAADAVWTRLNALPATGRMAATHPPGAERQAALRKAVAEIRTRQRTGKPLDTILSPR